LQACHENFKKGKQKLHLISDSNKKDYTADTRNRSEGKNKEEYSPAENRILPDLRK